MFVQHYGSVRINRDAKVWVLTDDRGQCGEMLTVLSGEGQHT